MCRAQLDRRRQMECQCGMEATWQWGPPAPLCRCLVQDSLQGSRRGRTAAAAAAPLLASGGSGGGGAGEEDTYEECQHWVGSVRLPECRAVQYQRISPLAMMGCA